MKITIDARLYGPSKNRGLGRYVEQLVKNLEVVDRENDYTILLRKDNYNEYSPLNSRFRKIPADYKWYSFIEQIMMPIKLRRLDCDLVHFPHFNVPLICPKKFVVTIHDLIMYKFPNERATTRNQWFYKIKYWLHKVVIRSAVRRAERVIVPSEWTKKDVIQEFNVEPMKIRVVYLGFEVGAEENGKYRNWKLKEDGGIFERFGIRRPYLLYVGSAYPHKNLERLIQTFKLAREKHGDLQLVLAGQEDYFYKKLKAYGLQLTAGIVFTGRISNGELVELYHDAAVYISPSFYEGFGLPGLEAMSYGVPVISAKASCLPEIYGEAALYFNPHDENELFKKIEQLLGNENLKKSLVEKGFEQIKKYSWRRFAKETSAIYTQVK